MFTEMIEAELHIHAQVLEDTIKQTASLIGDIVECICRCFQQGNKLMLCGNGGSAADAQHVAAELVNRFCLERSALPAIALTTDSSILTCIGNDSAFEHIFARQVEALARPGDVLVGISTSGRSANVLRALEAARARQVITVGFTGANGKESMEPNCDYCLVVPSIDTARIQECHEFVLHVICGLVERTLFAQG
ncbi:MAG: D-sedoheptulose 7-phosphate isomerase [Chloroflexi bacterium]|nr:D-sedoheptulose 7-phosphate isomerase [Chloroflexota bacterium]